MTGFYRDGCPNIGELYSGAYVVCAEMTEGFLELTAGLMQCHEAWG
jgi:uncharacterized protein